MTNDTQKPKRGRPRKEAPPRVANASDASQPLITAHMNAIAGVMRDTPILAQWLEHAPPSARRSLLTRLAHEVAFYPAMVGAVEATPRGRTGPKPKTAQALLLTQVRTTLAAAGIELPQWKNGWAQRTDLADFCGRLIAISDNRGRHISFRTSDAAPEHGWTPLP